MGSLTYANEPHVHQDGGQETSNMSVTSRV